MIQRDENVWRGWQVIVIYTSVCKHIVQSKKKQQPQKNKKEEEVVDPAGYNFMQVGGFIATASQWSPEHLGVSGKRVEPSSQVI